MGFDTLTAGALLGGLGRESGHELQRKFGLLRGAETFAGEARKAGDGHGEP
jgi:hypothetical protein